MWTEFAYIFPNFNGYTVDVCEWINNLITLYNMCNSLYMLKLKLNLIIKRDTGNLNPSLWRHNGCDGVSNHPPHDCLLNRLFRHRSKKPSKLHVTGLCEGNSPVTGEFPGKFTGDRWIPREIHRWPVNSPHKGPVTRNTFPFDDVIMNIISDSASASCVTNSSAPMVMLVWLAHCLLWGRITTTWCFNYLPFQYRGML